MSGKDKQDRLEEIERKLKQLANDVSEVKADTKTTTSILSLAFKTEVETYYQQIVKSKKLALTLLECKSDVMAKDLADKIGVSSNNLRRDIKPLIDNGLLSYIEEKGNVYYRRNHYLDTSDFDIWAKNKYKL